CSYHRDRQNQKQYKSIIYFHNENHPFRPFQMPCCIALSTKGRKKPVKARMRFRAHARMHNAFPAVFTGKCKIRDKPVPCVKFGRGEGEFTRERERERARTVPSAPVQDKKVRKLRLMFAGTPQSRSCRKVYAF
ncbi:MAG: hypothetical protein LBP20_03395, partial [Treponema sp.]|nr:hypothetical protein [Treponema sp.]